MIIPIPIIIEKEQTIITKMPMYTCGCGCGSFPCTAKKEDLKDD